VDPTPDVAWRLNDPPTVAQAFAEALREVDRFDRVVFAVRDGLPRTPVYAAFEAVFGFDDAVTTVAKQSGDQFPSIGIVFNYKNSGG